LLIFSENWGGWGFGDTGCSKIAEFQKNL